MNAGLQRSGADLSAKEYATSQREAPKDLAGVLDESANTLFLTELWRGLALTLKVFFEPPVTVGGRGKPGGAGCRLQPGGGPADSCRIVAAVARRRRCRQFRCWHPLVLAVTGAAASPCPHHHHPQPVLPRRSTTPLRRAR